ncbi:MAG: hypothetical protein KDA61_06405 [Planctomycetales bacterium]|nr:hypothetical protein [Planctomycetales bacterium]
MTVPGADSRTVDEPLVERSSPTDELNSIEQDVRRVQRLLGAELFLARLGRCLAVALAVAAVAIAVPKLAAWSVDAAWAKWALGGAVLGACAATVAWMRLRPQTALDAAMEIDRRYDLRERVASSLALQASDAQSPAGRALMHDARRALQRVDVAERFPIQWRRRAWAPVVPALIAALAAMFVDGREAQSQTEAAQSVLTQQEAARAESLRERFAQRAKQAKEKGLEESSELFRQLEKKAEQLAKAKDMERRDALVQLNDLAKQLDDRRKQLGGSEALKRQLAKMQDLQKGPGDKMAAAMKRGDWKAARQELEKMQRQLANKEMTPEMREKLQQQMSQLQKQLEQAAETKRQAEEELRKLVEKKKAEGDLAEAGRLQQKLDEMRKQNQQTNQMEKLAQQMSQAQQALEKGDQQAAADAMQQMSQQMEQLEQQMAESDMLASEMSQIEMAKDAMACDSCNGEGCSDCQGGDGDAFSEMFSETPGMGMGGGRGAGPRPDTPDDVDFRESRVRQKPGRGAAVIVGEAHGPNFSGQALEQIKEEMQSDESDPADPLVIEQMSKPRREHAEEYFNLLRDGQ